MTNNDLFTTGMNNGMASRECTKFVGIKYQNLLQHDNQWPCTTRMNDSMANKEVMECESLDTLTCTKLVA